MDDLRKALKTCIYVIGILCILGFVISIIGEELFANVMTFAVIFLAGYGCVTLIKTLKEKG